MVESKRYIVYSSKDEEKFYECGVKENYDEKDAIKIADLLNEKLSPITKKRYFWGEKDRWFNSWWGKKDQGLLKDDNVYFNKYGIGFDGVKSTPLTKEKQEKLKKWTKAHMKAKDCTRYELEKYYIEYFLSLLKTAINLINESSDEKIDSLISYGKENCINFLEKNKDENYYIVDDILIENLKFMINYLN